MTITDEQGEYLAAWLKAHPVTLTDCPVCDGEGYLYVEQAGRHAEHPIAELRCARCGGTGLTESRTT